MTIDEFPDTIVQHHFDVRLCRIVDNIILPAKLTVRSTVLVNEEVNDADVDLGMAKVQYWINHFLAQSIAFSVSNDEAVAMMVDETGKPRIGNRMMLTPEEPSDEHLAQLLQAKLTALGGGALAFGDVEVQSDNASGLSFIFVGDPHEVLPSMLDWVGERNWFSVPWWHRDDASMLDTQPPADADITETPGWAIKLDFLAPEKEQPEAIVVPGNFRPRVIEGEKDTD